jgi:hypothetical protein
MEHLENKRDDPGAILYPLLATRGIAPTWATSADPVTGVRSECQALAADHTFIAELSTFLNANPIIASSCESMLAQLALAAGVRWQDTAPILQPLSRRGWHIGRWLPTFLLISGPLGYLLCGRASPLNKRLRGRNTGLPLLSEARDAFNHNTFRQLRNGFGHWSFEWNDQASPSEIRVVDWETGRETVTLSLLECEALHFLTVTVVREIDGELIKRAAVANGVRPQARAL